MFVGLQNLAPLGDLVNKVAESCPLDWSARVKLIDCIYYFLLLDPCIAQVIAYYLLTNKINILVFDCRNLSPALDRLWMHPKSVAFCFH